ncbi:ATP-binding protein [Desulfovibrio aminophilus]|nr:ATP-binding protein [Desulfovibrio aminophilus]MCM0755737.1 ATP-binding protein [Desulfovibrio aminophilus]
MEPLLHSEPGRKLLRLGPALLVLTSAFLAPVLPEWGRLILGLATAGAVYWAVSWLAGQTVRSREEETRLGEELLQSQKMAAVGQLSSGIAHEINTPLAVIGQEAELLLMGLDAEALKDRAELDATREGVRQISLQVERCREITHKLLSLSRKLEAIVQDTDVSALAEDMAMLVEKEARLKSIVIRRNYAASLPPVATDPALLRQVILNLLNNAMQAVGCQGSVTVSTDMTARDRVRITVDDTGPGISPDNLSKIFNPFFTTKPPGQGTGLGLSMCMTIMERLGGTIQAASPPGQGARFEVVLPLRREAA